jgi:hypothetical protein
MAIFNSYVKLPEGIFRRVAIHKYGEFFFGTRSEIPSAPTLEIILEVWRSNHFEVNVFSGETYIWIYVICIYIYLPLLYVKQHNDGWTIPMLQKKKFFGEIPVPRLHPTTSNPQQRVHRWVHQKMAEKSPRRLPWNTRRWPFDKPMEFGF